MAAAGSAVECAEPVPRSGPADSASCRPVDYTQSLPNELLIHLFLQLTFRDVATCSEVCRRWNALFHAPAVRAAIQTTRWADYASGVATPRVLAFRSFCPQTIQIKDGIVAATANRTDPAKTNSMLWRVGRRSECITADWMTEMHLASNGVVIGLKHPIGHKNSRYAALRFAAANCHWPSLELTDVRTPRSAWFKVITVAESFVFAMFFDRRIQIWDAVSCQSLGFFSGCQRKQLSPLDTANLVCTGNGNTALLCSYCGDDPHIKVWSVAKREWVHNVGTFEDADSLVLAAGARGELLSGDDHRIHVWNPATGALLRVLQGHFRAIEAIAVGDDGTIYSGCGAGRVCVWRDLETTATSIDLDHDIESLAVSENGALYVAFYNADTPLLVL